MVVDGYAVRASLPQQPFFSLPFQSLLSSDWAVGLLLSSQKCFPLIMCVSCSWEVIFSGLVRLLETLRDRALAEGWKRELPANGLEWERGKWYLLFPSIFFYFWLHCSFLITWKEKAHFSGLSNCLAGNNLCVTEAKLVELHEWKLPFSLWWYSRAAQISTDAF